VAARFSWVIQTAPSTVARQIAPLRWAMISPGRPRSARSAWASKRWNAVPSTSSSTPGWPSAARILRITASVPSELQSIDRTSCVMNGRARPTVRGSRGSTGLGRSRPSATLPTASRIASIAA
jgi:hypothetical protein